MKESKTELGYLLQGVSLGTIRKIASTYDICEDDVAIVERASDSGVLLVGHEAIALYLGTEVCSQYWTKCPRLAKVQVVDGQLTDLGAIPPWLGSGSN